MSVTAAHITRATLKKVLRDHPELNADGYGCPKYYLDRPEDLAMSRVDLETDLEGVRAAARWIEDHEWGTGFTRTMSYSYKLKHRMEEATGQYVTNGAFIAACYAVGCPVKANDGLNPMVAIRMREGRPVPRVPAP